MDIYLTWTIICLLMGILLLVVEMFTPGFGVAGILGIIVLFAAVMLQMGNPSGMLFLAALVLFIIAVMLIIFFRLATKGSFDRSKIVLMDKIAGESTELSDEAMQEYVGLVGVTLTPLRPAGKAMFERKTLDVVTGGEFLQTGVRVAITAVEGLRILVEKYVEPDHESIVPGPVESDTDTPPPL